MTSDEKALKIFDDIYLILSKSTYGMNDPKAREKILRLISNEISETKIKQKISFDYSGTLNGGNPAILQLAIGLIKSNADVYILTNTPYKYLATFAKSIGIDKNNILYSGNEISKARFILQNNIDLDIHFDDSYKEIADINTNTNTLGLFVS